jgi:hypothetical protein
LLAGPSASSSSEPSANPLLPEPFDNITNSTMHVSRDQINSNKTKAAILFVLFFFFINRDEAHYTVNRTKS